MPGYLMQELFPDNPHAPYSEEWREENHRQHVRRLDTDPEYARDYAEACAVDNYLSDIAEREFEGEGNEPDNDDPIQSIEWL